MQDWLFWAAATAITLGVGLLLVQALRRGDSAADEAAALKVYRDQLTEVDRDLARAVLSPAEAERVKIEVSRRLLDADRAISASPVAAGTGSTWASMSLVCTASAAALAGYYWLGAPGYPDLPLSDRYAMSDEAYRTRPSQADSEAAAPAAQPPAVQPDAQFLELMEKLRAAIVVNPDDQQGLLLLAKNEVRLGNFIAARKAYEHLVELKGTTATADDHAGLAQTMIFAAGGRVSPEAEKHLIRALELDPTNGIARYFSGVMFDEIGRPDSTFALWERLLREGPEAAPWIKPIRAMLPGVAEAAGIKYQPPAVGKGPTAADMSAASEMTPEQRQDMIKGMVGTLETRLNSEGGPVEDWIKLINALAVLGEKDRAKAAYEKAAAAFKSDDTAAGQIEAAASQAGVTP